MYSCKINNVHVAASTADAREKLLARPGKTGILAGGTSFIFTGKKEIDTLVDLRRLPLQYIRHEAGALQVGAMTRLTDLCRSPGAKKYACGIVEEAAHRTGSTLNRNLCTLGGLLVHPFIWPELSTAILALNATLVIFRDSEVALSATDFYAQSPSQNLACGDIVTEVIFPAQPENRIFSFDKYSSTHNEFAWLALAIGSTIEPGGCLRDVRITAGAASPLPQRLTAAEEALEGRPLTREIIRNASEQASQAIQVGRDIRCSVHYKRCLCAGLLRGMLEEDFSRSSSGK